MSRRLLTRGCVLVGCACFATVTGAASCSRTGSSGTSVSGSTLSIYASVPPGALSQEAQDVLSAERLAFKKAGGRVGQFRLRLVARPFGELSANARRAIVDKSTIAYLGEIAPGSSADTLGITNAEDVLQVSPTDTAVELTRSTPAISNTPDRYYESLGTNGRTFARVVPTDALEAGAVVGRMQAMGIGSMYVASDGSAYGAALKSAVLSRARSRITIESAPSGADAVFYAGSSASGAAAVFNQAVSGNAKVALFAPSALAQNSFATSLSSAAQRNLYVSSPGFTSSDLTAQGRQFVSAFTAAYGHAPATEAIFGYAAMAAVIHTLQHAGDSANSRSTVVHDFFGIRNLNSALGSFSIDKNGDTNLTSFVILRVKGGKLVPEMEVQGQG